MPGHGRFCFATGEVSVFVHKLKIHLKVIIHNDNKRKFAIRDCSSTVVYGGFVK